MLSIHRRTHGPTWVAAFIVVAIVNACGSPQTGRRTFAFQGRTMGTTFTVKVIAEKLADAKRRQIQDRIDSELQGINAKMSHYLEDSELSRFNRSQDTMPFPVSRETFDVLSHAQQVSEMTGGAFDITVGPLVNLWGFGPEERPSAPPTDQQIVELLPHVSYTRLELDPERLTVRKREPGIHCDLSAIAKGYAVDRVAEVLEREGLADYMVEVGGEVRTGGKNDSGLAWRIAIERPVAGERAVQRIVPLSSLAVATSGGYRNYYEIDGVRLSHTIDPRTGRPINHRLASVSVVDELCVRADGLATGLLVLGPDEGYRLARERQVAALFLVDQKGEFLEKATPAFEHLLQVGQLPRNRLEWK